jgi:hypothetical protein
LIRWSDGDFDDAWLRHKTEMYWNMLRFGASPDRPWILDGDFDEAAMVRDALTEALSALQIGHFWRFADDHVEDIAIPRLDTPEPCVAYVLGLAMQDRQGLRKGIKRCRLWGPSEQPHYFVDLPNSKQMFCCPRHAATFRKRVERSNARKARKARKPK